MIFNIITLFPEFFKSPLNTSLIKKAQEKNLIKVNIYNLRDFTKEKHKQCDDKPYGGGAGMVMMIEPIYNALQNIKRREPDTKVIFLSPQGKLFNDEEAEKFSNFKSITLLCGHYEGVDYRVVEYLIDEEISIGDYILTGGEPAALVVIDSVSRYIPGVVQKIESIKTETFRKFLLKYPQYTRPPIFKGMKVPDVLLSGNHQKIKEWRYQKQIELTKIKRPDLYEKFKKERCKSESNN